MKKGSDASFTWAGNGGRMLTSSQHPDTWRTDQTEKLGRKKSKFKAAKLFFLPGLRKFWDKRMLCALLRWLAVSNTVWATASCIAWARRKAGAPKLSAALIFFGYFLASRQKSNWGLGQSPRNTAWSQPTPLNKLKILILKKKGGTNCLAAFFSSGWRRKLLS